MGESRGLSEPRRPRGSLRTAPRETLGRALRPAAGSGWRAEGRSWEAGERAQSGQAGDTLRPGDSGWEMGNELLQRRERGGASATVAAP